jgi:hypothetical protein
LRYLDREGVHDVVGVPPPIHIYICIYIYVHIYIYTSIKKGLHRMRQLSAFTGPTVLPYTHMILDTAAVCVAVRMSTCVRVRMRECVSGWMFDWLSACVRWCMHSSMKWGWGILLQKKFGTLCDYRVIPGNRNHRNYQASVLLSKYF